MAEKQKLDSEAYPTLAEWIRQTPNEFRERTDYLATRARQETNVVVQRGLQVAVQLMPVLNRTYGGQQ